MTILSDKRIILGVTGSIAAYKAAVVASQLTQAGAQVDVIMTEAARRFVTPLTFQALTGRAVYTGMWESETGGGLGTHIAHVGLAHQADLLLIAPATAHTIARLAHGLADDLLSVTALAARCPLVIAPAMDVGMYENPATQANLNTLRERGVVVAGPAVGRMASGFEGLGRLIEPEEIVGHCRWALGQGGRLAGRRVVVSAGPTQEPLDPVRYLTNYSSGKQGFALAQAALDAGAEVTLITGPVGLPTPVGARRVDVASARQMRDAVLLHAVAEGQADALIMSAAVADFRPAQAHEQKVKKEAAASFTIELARNPDILLEVSEGPTRPRVTIGFAAESEDLLENAEAKLAAKKLDLIVANDITAPDAGFAADTNRVFFLTAQGVEELPLMSKEAVAERVIGWLADRLGAG
ncbi:MAG: bifunctional phosphopantothenoylcysteine decarboxylase/phosphopantothenate--cysteine ligase CoaBC [Chloroflexota bacterium]